jgi:hypothetical protein
MLYKFAVAGNETRTFSTLAFSLAYKVSERALKLWNTQQHKSNNYFCTNPIALTILSGVNYWRNFISQQ